MYEVISKHEVIPKHVAVFWDQTKIETMDMHMHGQDLIAEEKNALS